MEYTVKFKFNCINKRSQVFAKTGEVDIETQDSIEDLKSDGGLVDLISGEMARKTRHTILSVDVTDVVKK